MIHIQAWTVDPGLVLFDYMVTPTELYGGFLCLGNPLDCGQPNPLGKECWLSCQDESCHLFHRSLYLLDFSKVSMTPRSTKTYLNCKALTHAKCKDQTAKVTLPHLLPYFPGDVQVTTSWPRKVSKWNAFWNLDHMSSLSPNRKLQWQASQMSQTSLVLKDFLDPASS